MLAKESSAKQTSLMIYMLLLPVGYPIAASLYCSVETARKCVVFGKAVKCILFRVSQERRHDLSGESSNCVHVY